MMSSYMHTHPLTYVHRYAYSEISGEPRAGEDLGDSSLYPKAYTVDADGALRTQLHMRETPSLQ